MNATMLDSFVRQKIADNQDARNEIRNKILERVQKEFEVEAKALNEENELLRKTEKEFQKLVTIDVENAYKNKKRVKVWSQVGKNASLIREYTGHIDDVSFPSHNRTTFNMISFVDSADGKRFSIGISCFMGIEFLD